MTQKACGEDTYKTVTEKGREYSIQIFPWPSDFHFNIISIYVDSFNS